MSIYDRLKSQPLMRMQEGGEAMTPEQQAFLDKYVQEAITNFLGGNFTTPGIDLGGGLGGMPGVTLNMQDILAGLPQNQMYGIPTVFTDPVEDEVVEDEVVEDEVETTAPVMPVAPVNDPVVEVVSDEVAEEVAPTPTPAPAPAPAPVVPTTGIGTLPQVVLPPTPAEEMNLITGTDAPLTEEEIYNVATPTMTPTTGNDIARLNQQYNDTFLKMLVQDPVNAQAAAQANQPVYGPGSDQGAQSGLLGGETISRYAQSPNQSYMAPGITGTAAGGASMQDMFNNYGNYQQTYSTPADVQFQMDSIFGNNFANNTNNNNNQGFNNPYAQYGNLQFPVFGSGVTSLVPQDAVNELYTNRRR
jgi:hypothetical protein